MYLAKYEGELGKVMLKNVSLITQQTCYENRKLDKSGNKNRQGTTRILNKGQKRNIGKRDERKQKNSIMIGTG